jgi:hypothetical protein
MASGFFNALQAALAGVAGGAQGYSEYEAEQNRRQRQAQSELLSALAAGYEPPDGAAQEIEIGGKRLKLTETPAARARREAKERNELERERMQLERDRLAQQATEGKLGRETQLQASRISAGAATQRDILEREAKTGQQRRDAEAWWNSITIPQKDRAAFEAAAKQGDTGAQARLQAAGRAATAFNRVRAANPNMDPRDIFASLYTAEQQFATGAQRASAAAGEPVPQANVPTPRAPSPYTEMQRAQRFEQLRAEGKSAAEAQAQVLREMPR